MRNKIVFLNINKLKSHERVSEKHVGEIVEKIKKDGCLKRPILVEKESSVILDGHHRYRALQSMGIRKIPAFMVDYNGNNVRVYLRRKKLLMKLIKETVIRKAREGKLFPQKTTRHLLKNRPKVIKISLEQLRQEKI